MAGKRLFHRSARGVDLTHEGEVLLGYARRILELTEEAQTRIAAPDIEGIVRVGIPEDFANRYLPTVLARFSRAYEKIQLQVSCDLSVKLMDGLERNEFDLILVKRAPSGDSGVPVWRERLVWTASMDYPVEQMDPLPLIMFPHGCIYRKLMLDQLETSGKRWWISYVSPSLSGLQAALRAGLGVTVLARSSVPGDCRAVESVSGFPPLPVTELALHYASSSPPKAAVMLAEYITERMDEGALDDTNKSYFLSRQGS
jgi:DNA-binding transcriptional LysR family regulator